MIFLIAVRYKIVLFIAFIINKLLEELIFLTAFKTDKSKYRADLLAITVCAAEYRYNFDLYCKAYFESVVVCDELLTELIKFEADTQEEILE
ncbi:hypothetical protein PN36_32775 [Candidatus Thiomargarita nelsonii]|uniref:Uncharacterized protein n=1 Tax=Candidatus Thiomargarita nelsonii TaxID=1003181 RepID=A0A0A6RTJ1_9GAMM|nr:hypothetical protein PN36_32775 [Candidatus Thiomargarita nelsonii]